MDIRKVTSLVIFFCHSFLIYCYMTGSSAFGISYRHYFIEYFFHVGLILLACYGFSHSAGASTSARYIANLLYLSSFQFIFLRLFDVDLFVLKKGYIRYAEVLLFLTSCLAIYLSKTTECISQGTSSSRPSLGSIWHNPILTSFSFFLFGVLIYKFGLLSEFSQDIRQFILATVMFSFPLLALSQKLPRNSIEVGHIVQRKMDLMETICVLLLCSLVGLM